LSFSQAGGLLTGKHRDVGTVAKGRFANNENYLPRFYTASNFEAVALIQRQCEEDGTSMVDATLRWLLCHSALDAETDGFLVGASSPAQLDQNLEACRKAAAASKEAEPLSPGLLDAFDRAWGLTREGAFPYWRSYSSDMPDRENMDQGASYDASRAKS
jgi:aflatoxin B1 aldehyde reductase